MRPDIVGSTNEASKWSASTYGEGFADVYDDWYGGITDAAATARFVAARAGTGPVIELGVGSGRLVEPLLAEGCAVIGIDASPSMLSRAQHRFGANPSVSLIQADMGRLPLAPRPVLGAALCAFNTLFNLGTADEQAGLIEAVATRLHPDGCLVIEAITGVSPEASNSVGVSRVDPDRVVLSATMVDSSNQELRGQHVDISEDGIKLRPWRLRWTTPEQLDAMAAAADLGLAEQYLDWSGADFGPESNTRVAVYRPR